MTSIISTITWVLKCCTMKTKLLLMLALLASMWFLAGMPYFMIYNFSFHLFSIFCSLTAYIWFPTSVGIWTMESSISVTPFCWFVTASSMNMVPRMTLIPQCKLAMLTLRLHLVVTLLKRWPLMHMLYSLMTLLLRYSSFHKCPLSISTRPSLLLIYANSWFTKKWEKQRISRQVFCYRYVNYPHI